MPKSAEQAGTEARADHRSHVKGTGARTGIVSPRYSKALPPLPASAIRGAPDVVELAREEVGGAPYEYYPIGEYIVSAPGVCGGRLTFKYTRLDVRYVVSAMEAGRTREEILEDYGASVTPEALDEARRFASLNDRDIFERTIVVPVRTA
jgi:uncharacterized protein (DUF433 family)